MIKNSSQQGFGVIGWIIVIALIAAALNAYAYYNPSFSLARYSPLNYFRAKQDDIRISDLKKIEENIAKYYADNNEMPAHDGWCGRISGVLHPELKNALIPYTGRDGVPSDPIRGSTEKDYFYYRVDRSHYILMAALEIPRDQGLAKTDYIFSGCHDWPGEGVYNYRLSNLDN